MNFRTALAMALGRAGCSDPVRPALPRLGEIRTPTPILVGAADIADVHAHARAIEAGIPGSQRSVVPGVGHLMYLETPDQFSRTVIGVR